jgi:hypothetical protein
MNHTNWTLVIFFRIVDEQCPISSMLFATFNLDVDVEILKETFNEDGEEVDGP